MSTTNGLIIVTQPGQSFPKPFMNLAYGKFPTFMGSASVVNDGKPEVIVSTTADALPPIDEWLAILEENKNSTILMHFINSKKKLTDKDEQPFVLLKDDAGTTLVAACMEGEFFKAEGASEEYTDEYHVMNDVLGPQLRKIYTKICGSDLQKFEEELKDPDTEKLINSLSGNRGVVVLFTALGSVFKFEKANPLSGEFPAFWTSNRLGYEEKSSKDAEPEKKEAAPEAKKGGLLSKFTGGKPAPVIASVEPFHQKPVTIASENTVKQAAAQLIAPPNDLINKGLVRVKGWYDKHTTGKDQNGVKLTDEQMKKGVPAVATDEWVAQNIGKKKEMADKIAAAKEDKSYKEFVPVIAQKLKHQINEMLDSGVVKAITDKRRILNPDDLKAGPQAAPFSIQIGRDLTETLRWDDEIMLKFINMCVAEKDMTPLILLFREYRDELMGFMIEDVKKEDEVVVDDTKKEEPAVKAKGGLLGKFTKAA